MRPAVRPQDIEWAFTDGRPAIIAHVPDEWGSYTVYDLTRVAPEGHFSREQVRALLRVAERVMADSEPVSPNGATR